MINLYAIIWSTWLLIGMDKLQYKRNALNIL